MKKIIQIGLLLIIAAVYWYLDYGRVSGVSAENQTELLKQYYQTKASKKMIKISGVAFKLLADDNYKPRHQKFLVRVDGGMSVLVTHNIDLAPRINSLNEGDIVDIYGQYEWNDRGGIIHWTHHDPKGRREGGWIIHNGKTYQ